MDDEMDGGKADEGVLGFKYRNREVADKVLQRLREMDLNIRIMHVCGTHQDTLIRFGMDELLREVGVEIRQGPGCPVCVTTPHEIEEAMCLARKGCTITTFGDMLRVPGTGESLADMHTQGYDVRTVYSINEAVKIARNTDNDVIFVAIGFETTAPSTAATLEHGSPPDNFKVLMCHRTIPQAMDVLLGLGELRLDGFIDPGHVSTIIGIHPYESISEKYHIPQVIAGFEPLDLLMAVYMIARQYRSGEARVENEYKRLVKPDGNQRALQVMNKVFEACDVKWRGFPVIPDSGMKLRSGYEQYDARRQYEDILQEIWDMEIQEPKGCMCGEVLRGVANPEECGLFARACTPRTPVGPCMVSGEGGCNIVYKYGKNRI